ncbi:hypothetical protein Srubr_18640 [Streptomyces rubradiris]|uniref:Uncharacterized protein n=1 Tax=Streptomyces rubradiris TaxID=285531 RepID=A0ABQ3R857_STRRR|nr:hypothetical protein [Streptomyces rubradiris]GHI52018.1 hypothetical protein Srubr_18640 [Streptomyces rubradiris]
MPWARAVWTALYGAGTLGFSRLLKRVAMRPAWSLWLPPAA